MTPNPSLQRTGARGARPGRGCRAWFETRRASRTSGCTGPPLHNLRLLRAGR